MTDHIADIMHYTQALAVLWPIKAAIAAIAAWFSTEPFLLYAVFSVMIADLAFGLLTALKHKTFDCRVFKRGGMKFVAYMLCIFLVGIVDLCITIAFHIDFPVLEVFLAYIVAQDAISIMGHMQRLGLKMPGLVNRILRRSKARMERQIDEMLDK